MTDRKLVQQGPSMADIPVAVLAGGLATRLGSISRQMPKALVDVAGRPFIDHQLQLLRRCGVRRVIFCLGHLGRQLQDHLQDGANWGMNFRYSYDGEQPLGTGGALRRALPLLGETFWTIYGDSYMDIDYAAVLDHFWRSQALALMTVLRNENRWDRSNVVFRDGRLLRYDKCQQTPEMAYIDYGVSILRRLAVERIVLGQPANLADLYGALVAEGNLVGFEVGERFYEIGTPAALQETHAYLLARSKNTGLAQSRSMGQKGEVRIVTKMASYWP